MNDIVPFNTNSYIAFDGNSIRDLIIDRLNTSKIFTDQNYQGSNISGFIDIISYTFSTLLYYLNKTSSESLFTEAQIYENMNRIVKLLNYNPKGKITQSVFYRLTLIDVLNQGNYVIPRYSFLDVAGKFFSFNKDLYFTVDNNNNILLQNPESDFFLYQGNFVEYPLYTALGINNEVLFLNLGNNIAIDHFNIDVYVKSIETGNWEQWQKTENLFLNKSTDKVFEIRYNPNKNYEIKFGDDINGKKIINGDQIQIYYLNIDPNASTIASNSLNNSKIIYFNSTTFNQIKEKNIERIESAVPINKLVALSLINDYPSNPYSEEESVDSIRNNAQKNFTYQQRLVTVSDFQTYLKNNYSNIISDVQVVNNDTYLIGHIKYLYNIGVSNPQLDNRILYSQVKFSNSCNFNNIYIYMVNLNGEQEYLLSSQKELILNDLQSKKILTTEIIPIDPVYMYLDFYVKSPIINPNIDDISNSTLNVYKSANSGRSSSGILNDIVSIINNTFNKQTSVLGQYIDISKLTSDILSIEGVDKIKTYRSDTDTYVNGISLLMWNNSNPSLDIDVHTQNLQLQYFQYPIFNNINNLISRINIIESSGTIQVTDF